jgi:hypothetical protein
MMRSPLVVMASHPLLTPVAPVSLVFAWTRAADVPVIFGHVTIARRMVSRSAIGVGVAPSTFLLTPHSDDPMKDVDA